MPDTDARSAPESRFRLALHLSALCAFVVAQPLFEVIGDNPEFFVAHRAGPVEVGLLAITLTVGLPTAWMLLVLAVARVSRRAGDLLGGVAVGLLVGTFALLVLKRTLHPGAGFALGAAAFCALLAGWAYLRGRRVRSFVTLLAIGIIAFPAAFFVRPEVRSLLTGPRDRSQAVTTAAARHDVIFVIFDQLPVSSLIDPDTGGIERRAYPAFAALADDATWFRNATGVNPATAWAIPAIVTGRWPEHRKLPTASQHPDSLFTFLEPTHRMHVVEPITELCPARVCPPILDPLRVRLEAMLDDLWVVYQHVVLPAEWTAGLPSVTRGWKNFAAARHWLRRWRERRDDDRPGVWSSFVENIGADAGPTLHYIHILLPHHPFTHLPNGQRYAYDDLPYGLSPRGASVWTNDEWLVTQAYQRHLMQVAFADRALGRLLARLHETGRYDDAVIVVTSDHGARFIPKTPFLDVTPEHYAEVMGVPLLVKRPGQKHGIIDDRNIESIDVVPTLAEILGGKLPWRPDGRSLARADQEGRPRKRLSYKRARISFEVDPAEAFARTLELARRKRDLFGPAHGPFRVPANPPAGEFRDRTISQLPVVNDWPGGHIEIASASRYARIDPTAPFLPAAIEGIAKWNGPPSRQVLAVAINGVVRATTRTTARDSAGRARWLAIVPPSAFKAGANIVHVLVVDEAAKPTRLRIAASVGGRPAVRPASLD